MKARYRMLSQRAQLSAVATAEGYNQNIRFESEILKHVHRYRQIFPWAREAGGQLFGLIEDKEVRVIRATGPYAGDERSRYRYRSNPTAAQRAIKTQARNGLLYLGEWHSHAEDHPCSSALDNDAMTRLMKNSRLNSNILLMLIVGRDPLLEGLTVLSIAPNKVHQWNLSIPSGEVNNSCN